MVWGIKKVDILTNFLLFRLAFCLFGCFETPKLPVSILKRNNRNKRLVSDSAETSFGSSFGYFDMKLVSEDTLVHGSNRTNINPNLPFQVRSFHHRSFSLVYCTVQYECIEIAIFPRKYQVETIFGQYICRDCQYLEFICKRSS